MKSFFKIRGFGAFIFAKREPKLLFMNTLSVARVKEYGAGKG